MLQGNITKNVKDRSLISNVGKALNNALKNTLFLEAIRNLNWSRGYSWYVELDGVPNPFQRGGVIGLPVTDVTIRIADGKTHQWEAGIETLVVPLGRNYQTITLTFIDDEQGTMCTFFERWYNMIYTSGRGVLPLQECVKQITITKTKSTRSNIRRHTASIDGEQKTVIGRDFLVFPHNSFEESEKLESGPRTYNIDLIVAKQLNADYGNPAEIPGQKSIMGIDIGDLTSGRGILDKLADYI